MFEILEHLPYIKSFLVIFLVNTYMIKKYKTNIEDHMNAHYIFKLLNKLEQNVKMQDFANDLIIFSKEFDKFNNN